MQAAQTFDPPLCVDLDGTIIVGDTLRACIAKLMLTRPWLLPWVLAALLRGRYSFKSRVVDLIMLDPTTLLYRADVLEFIRHENRRGRNIILATAADRRIGEAVAAHLGCFDAVIGSEAGVNLKGVAKVEGIRRYLRGGEFDYIGDSHADLPVFAAARRSYLVSPSPSLLRDARAVGQIERVFAG